MPIVIADSNAFDKPEFLAYLSESCSNKIIIPEQMIIEMHKGNPEIAIRNRLHQARQFPRQILLGISIPICYRWDINSGQQARRLIDYRQSKYFSKWYDDVLNVENVPGLKSHLKLKKAESELVISELKADVRYIRPSLEKIKDRFDGHELKGLARGEIVSLDTRRKLMEAAYDITKGSLSRLSFNLTNFPSNQDIVNYYLFRYALCMIAFFIKFVKNTTLTNDEDKLVNSVIDLHVAAKATYFHGVLSRDELVKYSHSIARQVIRSMNGYLVNI